MAVLGKLIGSAWQTYIEIYSTTNTATQTTVYYRYGVHLPKTLDTTFEAKYNTSNLSKGVDIKKAGYRQFGTYHATVNKTHSGFNSSVTYWLTHSGSGSKWKGTSTATQTFWVGAKNSYAVTYDGNKPTGTTEEVLPTAQTKWHDEALVLSGTIPALDDKRYAFAYWSTDPEADPEAEPEYVPSGSMPSNINTPVTLYAIWDEVFPPVAEFSNFEMDTTNEGNAIKNFTGLSVTCVNPATFLGKKLISAKLVVGSMESTPVTEFDEKEVVGETTYYEDFIVTMLPTELDTSGDYTVYLVLEDDDNRITKLELGSITVANPTWSKTVEVNFASPSLLDGNAVLDTIEVLNYSEDAENPTWEIVTGNFPATIVSEEPPLWTFDYTFDEAHVKSPTSLNPETGVRVSYKHYTSYEKDYREAFFNTTRNQNFSNGIYNVMFIGGVEENPNFTSRVWWSKINEPKYFPDLNYIEVGSNDTAVMGLTKVGDYLGVVKQSKTTDTAIFLVYPTSFEDETTYAVRQGVQGVGALARYSFNILGDETLFLSPKGVMAVVPSQDEEHKVQNRSYFIDGKLLDEPEISNCYSFVHDGKYWLATGGGAVYVLDGNQRNSWGNDKTNLVYECYYLDNVPAKCFVKYKDKLVFSTDGEVCIVGDGYQDAYGYEDGEKVEFVPVKAEWSTILDDDGSLHYYKTMQKKGNLVSILPMENETPYKQVFIDETTFNENKTLYFTLVGDKYVRCTEDSVFNSSTNYYIENRTNTKVFVKKDGNDETEIERSFSLSSDIPSEMFLKKKFKKYKRLQFIIRNDAPEPFGVDSIIKNYTVGNYAKK